MSDYDKGYRAGVMAERRRAMLVALRAVAPGGKPSMEGHALAHQIGRAGNQIPAPVPEAPEEWSVFGERRRVRELPSHLEAIESPFTTAVIGWAMNLDYQLHIDDLEEKLADAPERIAELEKLVETLSLQLAGVID